MAVMKQHAAFGSVPGASASTVYHLRGIGVAQQCAPGLVSTRLHRVLLNRLSNVDAMPFEERKVARQHSYSPACVAKTLTRSGTMIEKYTRNSEAAAKAPKSRNGVGPNLLDS